MYRICKTFKFCAAHRLESSWTEACQEIHGHNYRVDVILEAVDLNMDGMVIDFGKVKNIIKPIIDAYDHRLILKERHNCITTYINQITLQCNPTSENIARLIYESVARKIEYILAGDREKNLNGSTRVIALHKIRLYETDSSWAEYSL